MYRDRIVNALFKEMVNVQITGDKLKNAKKKIHLWRWIILFLRIYVFIFVCGSLVYFFPHLGKNYIRLFNFLDVFYWSNQLYVGALPVFLIGKIIEVMCIKSLTHFYESNEQVDVYNKSIKDIYVFGSVLFGDLEEGNEEHKDYDAEFKQFLRMLNKINKQYDELIKIGEKKRIFNPVLLYQIRVKNHQLILNQGRKTNVGGKENEME